jgi:hypothetical protein
MQKIDVLASNNRPTLTKKEGAKNVGYLPMAVCLYPKRRYAGTLTHSSCYCKLINNKNKIPWTKVA